MSKRDLVPEFDQLIKLATSELDIEQEEKEELQEEWLQHLYDHYQSLRKKKVENKEAIEIVIEQFGDIQMLQEQVNQTYPSATKVHVQNTVIIALVCLLASIIGPVILIGAKPHFPLGAVVFAYFIYRFVVSKQRNFLLSIFGFVALYLCFISVFTKVFYPDYTLNLYISQLFSLDWHQLTGHNGIFEVVTIHMMWYAVLVVNLISSRNNSPWWGRLSHASFRYWSMVVIGIFLARFQSSAEAGVLFLNVFLLYGFLQQVISVQTLIIWKEKIKGMFTKQRL